MKMKNFFAKTKKHFDTEEEWKMFVKLRGYYHQLKEKNRQQRVADKWVENENGHGWTLEQ
jgi:hypothetical protein